MKIKTGLLLAASALIGLAPYARAGVVYTETGDAGQTLASSQLVNTQPGGTTLDQIVGLLDQGDLVDIYTIYLTGGQTFSATTVNNTFFDTELFLFDSNGLGVYANDDDNNSPPQSTLPSGMSLTPTASGIYYLAITSPSVLPESSTGYIFPVFNGLLNGTSDVVGPTGPGGPNPLTDFNSVPSENGTYEIDLTGAQFLPNSSATPEPSTEFLLGGGLLVAALAKKFRSAK